MAACEHSQHWSLDTCPGLTPDEIERGERIRSVAFSYGPNGREQWHDGQTRREFLTEMYDNAKRYDIEPEPYGVTWT